MRGGSEPGKSRQRTDVERLVVRVSAGDEGDPRWNALLRVLTAAARGADVDPEREQAAVIAFRAAASAGPGRPAGTAGARRRRRSAGSARAMAGGLAAVFALCGAAVAAGAGILPAGGHTAHGGSPSAPAARTAAPAPLTRAAPDAGPPPAPGTPSPRPPVTTGPAGTVPQPGRSRAAGPRDRPQAAARALCRAWTAARRDGRTPAARLTARLQREAGQRQRVAAYCRRLLSGGAGAATK